MESVGIHIRRSKNNVDKSSLSDMWDLGLTLHGMAARWKNAHDYRSSARGHNGTT